MTAATVRARPIGRVTLAVGAHVAFVLAAGVALPFALASAVTLGSAIWAMVVA